MKDKKVFLVIQGHTQNCDEVLHKIKDVENVVWSTEMNMPHADLEKIEKSGVELALGIAPRFRGYGNINIQSSSTVNGLNVAKSLGATHAIKIRSDLMFKDPKSFMESYPFDERIHQMAYIEHTEKCVNCVIHYPGIPTWLEDKGYQDIITDVSDYNYISDFANLGPIDEMLDFWDYPQESNVIKIPAEFKFVLRYLKNKGHLDIKLTYEWMESIFGFFISYCKQVDNPLVSMKHDWDSNGLLESQDIIFRG
jgi:hypothetical protein